MNKLKISPFFVLLAAVGIMLLQAAGANAQAKPASPAPLTGIWTVDPVHTNVNFTITHLGLSEVQGRFDTVSGTIIANKADLNKSSVDFTIQVDSINTNNGMRDTDMKSKAYFDAADFATITFKSTKISKAGAGYVALGDLTIKGVTKQVSLPFTIKGPIVDPWGSSRIGIVTNTKIDRVAYGVGGNDKLSDGSWAIGRTAVVSISLEATAAKK
jgi:polyisoprenoid-binding protein YceI